MTARLTSRYQIKDGKIVKGEGRMSVSARIAKRKKSKVPRLTTRAKADHFQHTLTRADKSL